MDDKGLEELASSIKQTGILQPLLVRPETWLPGPASNYEIVCGHRRYEAATMVGLLEVPCIIREMTGQEAAESALVDNLQRVDVPALEEAEAFGALLALHGTIEAVAARVGKDVSHVAKRLRLQSLGLSSCDALRQRLITVDHALLLARLGVDEQSAALKWCLDTTAGSKTPVEKVIEASAKYLKEEGRRRQWEPESVVRLREHIEQSSGRKLSRAPWSLDGAELVTEAGACSSCPSNTKANRALFEDLDIEEATCADGACFERKRAAFVQIRLRTATDDAFPPVRLSWKFTSTPPRMELVPVGPAKDGVRNEVALKPKLDQVFKHGQWALAKKGTCTYARAGVTVDWSDANDRGYMNHSGKLQKPGDLLLVCIAPKCKVHKKEYEKPKSENTNSAQRVDPAEEKKRQEKQAHLEKVETEVRLDLFRAILGKLDAAKAIHLLADRDGRAPQIRETIFGLIPKVSGNELEAFTLLYADCERDLESNGCRLMQPDGVARDRKELWAMAKSVGVDADETVVRYFHEVGIAPASDPLYPKGGEKIFAKLFPVKKAARKAGRK